MATKKKTARPTKKTPAKKDKPATGLPKTKQ